MKSRDNLGFTGNDSVLSSVAYHDSVIVTARTHMRAADSLINVQEH